MFWTPPSIPWLTLCLWFIWLGTASWNFLVTSSECRAVASLTVLGGQESHFPHFFLKFWSIFPQTLLIFFLILALRVGESPTREGPSYATVRMSKEEPARRYALYIPTIGKRRPGRPRTSYLNYVQRLLGDNEGAMQEQQIAAFADDRRAWRNLVVACSAADGWWWWLLLFHMTSNETPIT